MTKSPEKNDADPTADPKFKQVVQHFLKTPHKPHVEQKMRQMKFVDAGAKAALAELANLFPRVSGSESLIEKIADQGLALILAQPEGFVTLGASDVIMSLKPSGCLIELVSAIRAGELDADILISRLKSSASAHVAVS